LSPRQAPGVKILRAASTPCLRPAARQQSLRHMAMVTPQPAAAGVMARPRASPRAAAGSSGRARTSSAPAPAATAPAAALRTRCRSPAASERGATRRWERLCPFAIGTPPIAANWEHTPDVGRGPRSATSMLIWTNLICACAHWVVLGFACTVCRPVAKAWEARQPVRLCRSPS
jgi:hypothetical protein